MLETFQIAVRKECKGQGDESGNSMLSTPIPLLTLKLYSFFQTSVSYTLPQSSYFQVPQAQLTPISTKTTRFMKPRQRMQLMSSNSPILVPPYRMRQEDIDNADRGTFGINIELQCCSPPPEFHVEFQPGLPPCQWTQPEAHQLPVVTRAKFRWNTQGNYMDIACRVPNNTPNSEEDSLGGKQKLLDLQQWIPQIHSRMDSYVQMDPRESHNEKEKKKRRLRIKNACQEMKSLLPCVCDKTDNATVFENAVHFITFMKETVRSDYDMIEKVDAPCRDHLGKQAQIPTLRISAVE
ncbi:BHLH domain-containing protein [Caerostris extrusa]|uniref:BHLH domain-containing protein n=1 Tax=Caerostris extrusa TaxID=172846 RepID=A0AAV4XUV7_CAEEX|nr:BHLH domain-containing protein [Caerostris extrusa]